MVGAFKLDIKTVYDTLGNYMFLIYTYLDFKLSNSVEIPITSRKVEEHFI